MGGSAFSNPSDPSAPSLLTPRMPPPVYEHTRDRVLAILRTFYTRADCPIEAPGKLDYGDIDVLVFGPMAREGKQGFLPDKELVEALGAGAVKRVGGGMVQFALPWPRTATVDRADLVRGGMSGSEEKTQTSSPSSNVRIEGIAAATATTNSPTSEEDNNSHITPPVPPEEALFIQLDLHISPTVELFEWELFHLSHGDLWPILGAIVRPFGLSPKPTGLYLRIAEIEAHNKRLSLIKLTNKPHEVLDFLDLDESTYRTRFESLDEMFRYIATCRYYDPRSLRRNSVRDFEGEAVVERTATSTGPEVALGGELTINPTKNDRSRAHKRPIFAQWFDKQVNQSAPQERTPNEEEIESYHTQERPTRADVVEDVKRVFGIGDLYEEKRNTGIRLIGEERMWQQIRTSLQDIDGVRKGLVMRGIKMILKLDSTPAAAPKDATPQPISHSPHETSTITTTTTTTTPPTPQQEKSKSSPHSPSPSPSPTPPLPLNPQEEHLCALFAAGAFDQIAEWVCKNWEAIEPRQKEWEKQHNTAHLLAKLERERVKAVPAVAVVAEAAK